jgi:hypothetical protein
MRARAGRNQGRVLAALLFVTVTAVLIVAGCGGSDDNAQTTSQAPATTTPSGATGQGTTGQGTSKRRKGASKRSSRAGEADQGSETTRDLQSPNQATPRKIAGSGVQKIKVQDGSPADGQVRYLYRIGQTVRLAVSSNRSGRLLIPKLRITKQIPARGTAEVAFTADDSGLYSVEFQDPDGVSSRIAVLAIR